MDYWSQTGRPMLAAALEAVCNSVEKDLAAEIQQRYEANQAPLLEEIARLKVVTARVDQLERENHALIQELNQLRRKQVAQNVKAPESPLVAPSVSGEHPPPTARHALAELSVNRKIGAVSAGPSACEPKVAPDWEKEYSRLAARHKALEKRHEETRSAARKFRDSRDSWTKYAQSLEAIFEKLEKKRQHNEGTNDQFGAPSSNKTRPTRADIDDALSGQTILGSSTERNAESANGSGPHEDAAKGSTDHERTAPSDTDTSGYVARSADVETQDGSDGSCLLPLLPPGIASEPMVAIKEEPSSDAPVVVSERKVRKRKHVDDDAEMAAPPRRIKSEQGVSSDPVITSEVPVFRPQESIDLDEDEHEMPTPRKQRPPEHYLRNEDVTNSRGDGPRVELHLAGERATRKQFDTSSRGPNATPDRLAASGRSTHELSRTCRDGRSPVKTGWTLHAAIADVAEETFDSFYSPKPQQARKEATILTPAQGRLHSLLNHGSPKKSITSLTPVRPGRDNASRHFDKEDVENNPPEEEVKKQCYDVPVSASPAVSTSPAASLRRHARDNGNLPKPNRLRDWPLAELKPENFKINPRSNNGYGYAFDEVVRSREERAELVGCIDPNCCGGKFRVMAESELSAGGPGILSRAADTKMMEDYLGNEAYRLVHMTREERQEIWLKAKIQDLADRYGRHRHRFARRPSPPGYWNPDFPSTQEIEKSKEEAEKLERGLVEERWREAMRGGGRWLFRDE